MMRLDLEIIRQAEEERLDELLSLWHWLRSSSRIGDGHATKALVAGDYRDSRQYDDWNGNLDAAVDSRIADVVDQAARELTEPGRTAIYVNARNCYTGLQVWHSARLPPEPELWIVLANAREEMKGKLKSAGVM